MDLHPSLRFSCLLDSSHSPKKKKKKPKDEKRRKLLSPYQPYINNIISFQMFIITGSIPGFFFYITKLFRTLYTLLMIAWNSSF